MAPNPPPTSSATTRTLPSSRPSVPVIAWRTPKTFCVDVQTLSPSPSGVAVTARGSIAAPATRDVVRRIFAVTLSDAKAALMSPYFVDALRATLLFMSECTFGAPCAIAEGTSPTPGSGSSSGDTCSAASWAW